MENKLYINEPLLKALFENGSFIYKTKDGIEIKVELGQIEFNKEILELIKKGK